MYNMNGTYCMYICMESLKLLQYFLAVKYLIDIFMKWSPLIAKILEVISLRLNNYYKTMMNCVTQWRLYYCRYKLAMYFFTSNMYIHTYTHIHIYVHTYAHTHTRTHAHTHTHTHSNIAVTKINFLNALLENIYLSLPNSVAYLGQL